LADVADLVAGRVARIRSAPCVFEAATIYAQDLQVPPI
jgi:hypothetical protein